MKIFSLIYLLLITAKLAAALAQPLVVLQTTDIHGHLTGIKDNWPKLATIINHERRLAGRDNLLLIDCGDTVAGTFAATVTKGDISIKMLNALQYDVWVPGNHDYDFGLTALLKYHQQFSGTMLAANLQIDAINKKSFASWKIFNRNGIKIAVIGLSLPDSEKNYWDKQHFSVITGLKVMPAVMKKINALQPDLIILAAHCGLYSADKMLIKLAQQYPEIALFLGGHTHLNIPGEKIGSNGWYVQAGKHAQGVAKINITFIPNSTQVDKISSSIIPVTDSTICDKQCLAAISHELKKIMLLAKQPVGITTTKISAIAKPGTLSSAAKLNGLAMAATAKTKIAFSSANYRANILPGKINRQQAFSLYPYQDTVCTLRLTAAETKAIIEEQLKLGSQYHWVLPVGLKIELHNNGHSVKNLYFSDGTAWTEHQQRVTIAFSSYDLAGIYGRKFLLLHKLSLVPECQGNNSGIKIYQAITNYINRHLD